MLLAIDVGNSHTVIGLFEGEKLRGEWRIGTRRERTADEYALFIGGLLAQSSLSPAEVTDVIVSSVVPPALSDLATMSRQHFHVEPLLMEAGVDTGLPVLVDNPAEVGADRVVNAVAAYHKYGGPLIVVDFGTATTFDVISRQGEYIGGAICPGIMISLEALVIRAAKLPKVELVKPKAVIGKSTVANMQSGIINGYAALVDGLVAKMKAELPEEPRVIATGGLASTMACEATSIDKVDELLTLDGLRLIYERNARQGWSKA